MRCFRYTRSFVSLLVQFNILISFQSAPPDVRLDDFIEELKRLRDEGQEREKLTEKDLEKARMQLKKRRQKEAKKKQRKREASKKQKGDKGGILLANPSEIAALAASGYPLDGADANGDPSLLLSHESEHHPQHPLDAHADSSHQAHHPSAQSAQHAHQQHAHHDSKHEEQDEDEGDVDIDDEADAESEEENNVVVHH